MKFNTSLSRLMEFVNFFYGKGLNKDTKYKFIQLLSPFAPHLGEELWSLYSDESVFLESWPTYDEKYLVKNTLNLAIQVNGKLRASIEVDKNISKEEVLKLSKNNENVSKFIANKEIIREIYVPNKIVNIVIK